MMILIAALAVVAALYVPRLLPSAALGESLERAEARLRRFGPVAVAIPSVLVVWWVWGELVPMPLVHDEVSYVLQAEIFARGRWTVPTPPLPEFFEQPHVLVVPAVASKYVPGHALLLAVGAFVGFPALVPLLLTAVTAALLFALVTRVANPWVALVAWAFWISSPLVLRFQPSYFSEVTTTALLLGSWWMLLEWRESRRRRWLLLMALVIGWGAITRPLTMLALAIPIGVVVIRDVIRLRRWRDFSLACAVGIAVLSMLPLWSAHTTGDWRLWPVELYRRDYMPYDKLGFTADSSPPRRLASLSAVNYGLNRVFLYQAKQHRVEALPEVVSLRVVKLAVDLFPGERLPFLVFAVVGLFVGGALRFAVLSALLLFAAYLSYPHWPVWTVYYLEIAPVVAAVTALGFWRAAQRVAASDRRARLSAALVALVLVALAPPRISHWHADHLIQSAGTRGFLKHVRSLPSQPAIVFVRYSPRVVANLAVVYNSADLEKVRVWVVHDLGERNAELRRRAPGRTAYYFDEDVVISSRR